MGSGVNNQTLVNPSASSTVQGTALPQSSIGKTTGFRQTPQEDIDRSFKGVNVTSGQDYTTNVPASTSTASQDTSGSTVLSGDDSDSNQFVNYDPTSYSGDYTGYNIGVGGGLTGQAMNAVSNYQLNVQQDAVKNKEGLTFTNPSGGPVTVHKGLFGGLVVTGNTMGVPESAYIDAYNKQNTQESYKQAVQTVTTPSYVQAAYNDDDDDSDSMSATEYYKQMAQTVTTPSYVQDAYESSNSSSSSSGGGNWTNEGGGRFYSQGGHVSSGGK